MRVVLLSLLAAGSLTASAVAQEAPAPVPPPQVPPAATPPMTPEPTPAPAMPATPMAPDAPPAAATPAVPAAPVVPEAPVAPEPPPAPPPAPTEATAVFFHNQLEKLCIPLVNGGDINKLAPALGYKKKRDGWEQTWSKAGGLKATISDPGANPKFCNVTIQHPINGLEATINDLHGWAIYRDWTLEDNAKRTSDMERSTRKWQHAAEGKRQTIVILTTRKVGGAPLNAKWDQTELIYSLTTY